MVVSLFSRTLTTRRAHVKDYLSFAWLFLCLLLFLTNNSFPPHLQKKVNTKMYLSKEFICKFRVGERRIMRVNG